LSDLHQAELVGAIDKDACVQREKKNRKRLRGRDETDEERAVREL
jgi:hypothetical protein